MASVLVVAQVSALATVAASAPVTIETWAVALPMMAGADRVAVVAAIRIRTNQFRRAC